MRSDGEPRRKLQLHLSTTSRPDAARRARRALATFHELEDDPERAADARLLVSELVANAVTHGSRDPQERVDLRAELDERCLRVTVSDGGAGFILGEDVEAPPPRSPPAAVYICCARSPTATASNPTLTADTSGSRST